jgi:hypothetical protein
MSHELSHRHRNTIEEIFRTPTSENIGWHAVRTLLEKVGTVEQEHNGKMKVTVGPETEVLHVPKGKQLDVQQVLDIRRMLTGAGFAPDGTPATVDEQDRDHGDARWGDPKDD